MDLYLLRLALVGLTGILIAWAPVFARKTHISYTVFFMVFGVLIGHFTDILPHASHFRDSPLMLHYTEIIVLIALMTTGLRIDHRFSLAGWAVPLRLVTITMLLSIAGLALLSYYALGFGVASALLIGATLAPTDPVLAADIQVGPPNGGNNDDVRFALTAEAGMNDGAAFPFVLLAIALATATDDFSAILGQWAIFDMALRLLLGLAIGFGIGKLITYLFFHLPNKLNEKTVRDGLVAIATTFLVYSVTEMVHGYGFIAVFVAAITIRSYKMEHAYHMRLHTFTDQIERWMVAILLILFGSALAQGALDHLTWPLALVGLGVIFVIRPVAALLGLIGVKATLRDRVAMSFYGIRGIGSFFYIAYAFSKVDFPHQDQIWSLAAFIVLVSLVVHGFTASTVMYKLRRWHEDNGTAEATEL